MRCLQCLLLISVWRLVSSDDVLTQSNLESLLSTERDLIRRLEKYLKSEHQRLDVVKRILENFNQEDDEAQWNPHYIKIPYNAFKIISRLTTGINLLNAKTRQVTTFTMDSERAYPKFVDLVHSMETLIQLQKIYRLNATKLARGQLGDSLSTPLTVSDCFELASLAYNAKDFQIGVVWMLEALLKLEHADDNYDLSEDKIVEFIAAGFRELNYTKQAMIWTQHLVFLKPNDPRIPQFRDYIRACAAQLRREKNQAITKHPEEIIVKMKSAPTFESVSKTHCRNAFINKVMDVPNKHKLTCRYFTDSHPFLHIAPLKMEELHHQPVYMFYDVISDADISQIRTESWGQLKSTSSNTGTKTPVEYRNSKTGFLHPTKSSVLTTLNQRILDFTGINSDQPIQMVSFSIGGYYMPDVKEDKLNGSGVDQSTKDKATVMFYMTDVIKGGETVFPYLGLTVTPVKNAALFWIQDTRSSINIPDGVVNPAVHILCPVIHGFAWVAIKSFPWHDQRSKLCTKTRNTRVCGNPNPFKQNVSEVRRNTRLQC